ncbi:MAG TPA: methyl-accepting chemotaxis protein, partial [Chromatiales bacterium]|nr:methyl-accepting chemotaxis protein [Chromatiales bacterium]
AQSAIVNARRALDGDADALSRLPDLARQSRGLAQGLPAKPARAIGRLADSLEEISSATGALETVSRVAGDLKPLSAELSDRVYALEGALTVQREPVVTAQLERLRLLATTMEQEVDRLLGGADPDQISQSLLDAQMGMDQIVRGLQEGDPELGLRAIDQGAARDALAAVASTASAITGKIRDVVSLGDQLAVLARSRDQLDTLAGELAAAPRPVASTPGGLDIPQQALTWLLAGALALFLLAAVVYLRSAGMRRTAQIQAEQNERNQQAIMRLLDELSSLADGDLTIKATVTEDITGAIADSINYAIDALRELVTTLNDSAIMVDAAARQTDSTAQQLAEASASQSKQIEAASEAIAQMMASIEEVSGNAERSSDVARHSVDVAHKGGDAVRRTIEGMNTIRETIQDTSKRIKRLGESSQEIGNIVELINDIAEQTNILALNASIQASMAGEAGRGFSVVADEVQRLAERSANATKQIEVLVRTIQADTNEAVVSMERSTTDVVGGALLAENAGAALEEIEQVSNQIASLVHSISESAREQGKAAEAVNMNMEALQQINSETASSTSETTESIRKLAELAAQLRESVSGFRLPEAGDDAAADT